MQQKINFRRERNFGDVFGDTLKFIKQNFKSLLTCIFLVAGPFLLVGAISMSYIQSSQLGVNSLRYGGEFNMVAYFASLTVGILISLLGHIVLISTVYNYMLLYYNKPFGEKITPGEVWKKVLVTFGRLFGSVMVIVLLFGALLVLLALALIGLGSAMGLAGGILGVLIFFCLCLIFIPVATYWFTGSFFVVLRDGEFVFTGMGKVSRYMRGGFWWTWLIMFVAMISLYILQILFSLPAAFLTMGRMFSRMGSMDLASIEESPSFLLMALNTFATICSSVCSAFLLVLCAFHFLGQEEKNEGEGLMSRIEEIK